MMRINPKKFSIKLTAFFWAWFYGASCALNPSAGFASSLPPLPAGPLLLTSVTQEQLSAEYWINRLPHPDKVLMTPEQVKQFNEHIHFMIGDRVDIFKMDKSRSGKNITKQLDLEYKAVKNRRLYTVDDKVIPAVFFEEKVKPVAQSDQVPSRIKMRWAVAVRQASVRALPTDVRLLEKLHDIEFDMLQFTQVKLWTPIGVYHESSDGKWFYVQAPYSRGWMRARDLAFFENRDDMKRYVRSPEFLNVTGESIPVFSGSDFTDVIQRPSMGTILPLAAKRSGAYEVFMPERGPAGEAKVYRAYVNIKTDVTAGFPAYTQRNIITQAFKLLGARYGWGGTYNGRDCSGFTHDVFLSMGIDMPRNSKEQGYVGTKVSSFEPFKSADEKTYFLKQAVPGITLLRMPMHLMLFIGETDGQFYVIHSTWAERVSMDSDQKNRINQVVVSDLTLNGRSYLGSLFDRLISINEVIWS